MVLLLAPVNYVQGELAATTASPARPSVRLQLDASRVVVSSQFVSGSEAQWVKFEHPVTGRFFCLESLSAQDGRAYAAVAELELQDPGGRLLDRTGWRVVYADSEELERENGSADNVIDGRTATFWHTQWGAVAPNHPHHLVLDLGGSQALGGFGYTPRPGDGTVGGRIKDFRIYVGDDLVTGLKQDTRLPATCYLQCYFINGGEDGLHLAYSLNGYRWDAMNHGKSVLKPEVGAQIMRDPSLTRGPDGTFHLVWTAAWNGNYIGHATSSDLVHWSLQNIIPVMTNQPEVIHCWAPELFWDAARQEFLLYWTSAFTNQMPGLDGRLIPPAENRIYCATSRDGQTFSSPRLFFDPGYGVNDATLCQANNRCRLFFRDEFKQRINWGEANDPDGPFEVLGAGLGSSYLEAPMSFQISGQTFVAGHAPATPQAENHFDTFKTTDGEHFEEISKGEHFPANAQQGTVLEVPGETLRPLIQAGLLQVGTTPEASELAIGNWIWTSNVLDRQTCRLWRDFDLPKDSPVVKATLRITADNAYTVYLDGVEVGRGGDPNSLTEYDVTWWLPPGHHILAVEAFNDTLDAGVVLGLRAKLSSGREVGVFSDASWRVAANGDRHWKTRAVPDRDWPPASTVAYAGQGWWQYPFKIVNVPPSPPVIKYFWQQTWFLLLLLLGCVLGVALSIRQRLQLVVQRRSQQLLERERVRIARDLHDDLGAGLTQLTLLGELLRRDLPATGEMRGRVDDVCLKARQLLRSIDEVVWVVNPRRDSVRDFAAFISEHTQEFLATTAIRCRQEVAEDLPDCALDLPQRRNLLLAVKEAVRNAARHSQATEVNLVLRVAEQRLEIVVEDNGRGFALKNDDRRNGLANMRQRLADIGGTCLVTTAPGQGCRIAFSLPLTLGNVVEPKI
jgi:signal transduction histidine kinase